VSALPVPFRTLPIEAWGLHVGDVLLDLALIIL
jgi:hypothetical protein